MTHERTQPPRWRFFLDIVLLTAFTFAMPMALRTVGVTPPEGGARFGFATAIQLALVLFAWLLLRLRGERLGDIGLKRPTNWGLTLVLAVAIAGFFYLVSYAMEFAGLRRSLSEFAALEGDATLLAWSLLLAFVGAGFSEEVIFRGFYFRSLAGGLGDGPIAWIVAAVLQAALFALAHAGQGPVGMAFTGGAALAVALVFLGTGRNLWPLILGHGLYDAARFTHFYLNGVS